MSYYPLSQITSNLHTNGGEFVYINTLTPYVGFYWKNSKGKYYTGKTPQDVPTQELTAYVDPVNETFNNANAPSPINKVNYLSTYDKLKSIDSFKVTYAPSFSPTLPTQQDYANGEMRRYFCKKTNEIIYLEVSKDTYDKLVKQDSTILWQLYLPFNLPWQLTGSKEQVYKVNKNIVELTSVKQKLSMLAEYLKMDFTKYYK